MDEKQSITTVRPRTDADFDGLEDALRACHAKVGWPLEGAVDARAFLCDEQGPLEQAWVAINNGEIVGHIAINQPEFDCPAVARWTELHGKEDRIAVVGRLFVNPAASSQGVVRSLYNAVTAWSQENDTQLIMYVVIWSAARLLLAETLTAHFGWYRYGDGTYSHPVDGHQMDALCYAASAQDRIPSSRRDVSITITKKSVTFSERFMQLRSTFRTAWRNPSSKSQN